MSTNQLHKTKLDQFRTWLESYGYPCRDTTADYQVLQVYLETGRSGHWIPIYERVGSKEHYTVDRRLDGLLRGFLRNPQLKENDEHALRTLLSHVPETNNVPVAACVQPQVADGSQDDSGEPPWSVG